MVKPICAVEGCDRPRTALDWCGRCYQRWRAHGDPTTLLRVRHSGTPTERFWQKVNKHGPVPEHRPELGPCWEWTGGRSSQGYARLALNGKMEAAHRLAYIWLVGPIPDGFEPDHLCRNRGCVKAIADESGPTHLEAVTHRENIVRGDAPQAVREHWAAKTHCPQGHPYDEGNTYRSPSGGRQCRACKNARKRAARRR